MIRTFASKVRGMMGRVAHVPTSLSGRATAESPYSNEEYWTKVNVTDHQIFGSREESLEFLDRRNSLYLFYENFINYADLNDKCVLDYGCGPGHDLVAFSEFAKPRRLVGVDISASSLKEAGMRLNLHGKSSVELVKIPDGLPTLPFESDSFDVVHSSGVLMCTPNMEEILAELRRILKPGGVMKLMIYNYDSIWLHLYVAFLCQIMGGIDSDLPLLEAFRRSTDGKDCPISRCYTPEEFVHIVEGVGLTGKFTEACISTQEMDSVPRRFAAINHPKLAKEHRDFLKYLTFDSFGRPCHKGRVAGIDALFDFTKR